MKEAKTISGVSVELFSDVAECIKPGQTITAIVGLEHLKHLCVDRPLRKIRKAKCCVCGKNATGQGNGKDYCQEHFWQAFDEYEEKRRLELVAAPMTERKLDEPT